METIDFRYLGDSTDSDPESNITLSSDDSTVAYNYRFDNLMAKASYCIVVQACNSAGYSPGSCLFVRTDTDGGSTLPQWLAYSYRVHVYSTMLCCLL